MKPSEILTREEPTSFTPGPWFHDGDLVFVDSRYQQCCGRVDLNGQCCGNPEVAGDYGEIAQTSECNASLIAAAPDLYEALRDLIENPDKLSAHKNARAALAKAEAKQ